ncbi:hypothetical protein RSOL_429220, partial [Rhizoctonia solani AG-3 Rhs1AP]
MAAIRYPTAQGPAQRQDIVAPIAPAPPVNPPAEPVEAQPQVAVIGVPGHLAQNIVANNGPAIGPVEHVHVPVQGTSSLHRSLYGFRLEN